METINIEVGLHTNKEEYIIDIAGFSGVDDVTNELQGLYEGDETIREGDWYVRNTSTEFEWIFDEGDITEWTWTWIEYFGEDDTLDAEVAEAANLLGIEPEEAVDGYEGKYDSDVEFAKCLADNLARTDSSWPLNHIDWDAAARDLVLEYSEEEGHYFRDM